MKSIKLEAEYDYDAIADIQRVYSSAVRSAFQFPKSTKEIDVRADLRLKFPELGSWLLQCAVQQGRGIRKRFPDQEIVFGGKKNFTDRTRNRITQAEYRASRLIPITIQGEAPQKSNRLFEFDLANQTIVFKPKAGIRINIKLKGIGANRQLDLDWLQTQIGLKPITIILHKSYVVIQFDDNRTYDKPKIASRTAGIDQNPNSIGLAIRDGQKIIHSAMFDLHEITDQNKKRYEIIQITQRIIELLVHFQVASCNLEKLTMGAKDQGKGRRFNRSVNNQWHRILFQAQLKKRLRKYSIEIHEVNCAYTSYIGNIINFTYPDAIAAAIEISYRHTRYLPQTKLDPHNQFFYLWKELGDCCASWVKLCKSIKNAKLKYRVSHKPGLNTCGGFRLTSERSQVTIFTR